MPLPVLLLLLAVVGAVAVLLARPRGDVLAPPPGWEAHDLAPGLLAALETGDVAVEELAAARFSVAFRGYRQDEVDATLDVLLERLAERGRAIDELETRLAELAADDADDTDDTDDPPARPDPAETLPPGEGGAWRPST